MNDFHTLDPFALAGEYVLGTLSARRRAEVEQAMVGDATLRAAVAQWEERLLPLTGLAVPLAPSAQLWHRIEQQVALPAAAPPQERVRGLRWYDSLRLWRALAAGGFAAAALMAVVPAMRAPEGAAPRFVVVLATPQGFAPGYVVQANAGNMLHLQPLVDTAVPGQNSLQLWTKADGWKGPVSLGLVKPGQPVDVALDKLPPLQPNQLFEITLEPKNGSTADKPTGPILYIGRAAKIM